MSVLHRNICCDPHLNCLDKTVQMRVLQYIDSNNKKNYPSVIIEYTLLSRALRS